jgi:hypothetical protein
MKRLAKIGDKRDPMAMPLIFSKNSPCKLKNVDLKHTSSNIVV